jgi:hypothetical protein
MYATFSSEVGSESDLLVTIAKWDPNLSGAFLSLIKPLRLSNILLGFLQGLLKPSWFLLP